MHTYIIPLSHSGGFGVSSSCKETLRFVICSKGRLLIFANVLFTVSSSVSAPPFYLTYLKLTRDLNCLLSMLLLLFLFEVIRISDFYTFDKQMALRNLLQGKIVKKIIDILHTVLRKTERCLVSVF